MKKIVWEKVVTREGNVLNRWLHFLGYSNGIGPYSPIKATNMLTLAYNSLSEQHFDKKETEKSGKLALDDFYKNNEEKVFKNLYRICLNLKIWNDKVKKIKNNKLNVGNLFFDFVKSYSQARVVVYYGHFAEPKATLVLKQNLEKLFKPEEMEYVLGILTSPKNFYPELNKYFNSVNSFTAKSEFYLDKINDKKVLKLINYLRKIIYFHEVTERICSVSFVNIKKILKEIGKFYRVNSDDLFYYTVPEIKKLFKKGARISSEEILSRRNFFLLLMKDKKIKLYSGKLGEEIVARELNKNKIENNIKELRGQVACKGKVKGVVKIICREEEMVKMNKGDILVSPMTTPKLMSAIHKAGAIVTDEGGLICHAAIVSRELDIPCVVGTIFASKVLRDGDLVEVDANKGIIKIINK